MENKIDLRWRKSSYSGNGGGNCVEVAAGGRVMIRDSQDRAGTVLRFPPAAWRKFADQVKRSLALDPAWRVSNRIYCGVRFPANGTACTLVLCVPAYSCRGERPWCLEGWCFGGTGRGFPRESGFLDALPDLPLFLAQVSSVSRTSSPVTGAAERCALRRAVAGHAGDAAHGAGQPAVVEL